MDTGILTLDDFCPAGQTIILRVDINSPIDHTSGKLADDNRIRKSIPTIRELAESGARTVILAHQGDIEDYHNLTSLALHAQRLSDLLDTPVDHIDDIAGPAAVTRIQALQPGRILVLGNVRYLVEEASTFVNYVKLTPDQMVQTRMVRKLAPLADGYVCEAIAAAHRYSPSLVGFAHVLPSYGGRLFVEELSALTRIKESPVQPCVFVLGGSRIADALSMMAQVLQDGTAYRVLTSGLTGEVMLLAQGIRLGEPSEQLIDDKGLTPFIAKAQELLDSYPERILFPSDFAIDEGRRIEIGLDDLPCSQLLADIGPATSDRYIQVIEQAATIFVNGPAGIYEKPASSVGTTLLWTAIADAAGYSVIGGGDSVAAAGKLGLRDQFGYVCTSGGGMVRFLSGQRLPVVDALRESARRYKKEQTQ